MTDIEWACYIVRHQSNRLFPEMAPFNRIHPYTCGNDSRHTPLFPLIEGGRRAMVCPDCDYVQDCGEADGGAK